MNFARLGVAPEKAVFRPALPLHSWPGFTGEHMATLTYKEQLLHPNWQRKRLEIMQRDNFQCRGCSDTQSTLHVHHRQYMKGRMAWEYSDEELVTLCEGCHETMHEHQGVLRDVLAKLPYFEGPGSSGDAVAVLAGWAQGAAKVDLEHVYLQNPHSFVCGEIAAAMERHLHMQDALNLLDVLIEAPEWVVRDTVSKLIADCHQRLHELPLPKLAGAGSGL